MLNRRDLIKLGIATLPSIWMPKLAQSETAIDKSNGIDKIFTCFDNRKDFVNICKENNYGPVPMYPSKEGSLTTDCWRLLLAAGCQYKTKYRFGECENFLFTKATDVFVDKSILKFFKYRFGYLTEIEDGQFKLPKVHTVDLRQYYEFYQNSLKQEFTKYTKELYLACDLSKITAYAAEFEGYRGSIIFDDSRFIVGQI